LERLEIEHDNMRAAFDALDDPAAPSERADRERRVAAVRADLSEEAFAVAWAEGRALSLDEAVTCALQVSSASPGDAPQG
jgi:hypothetical protein